MIHLVLHCFVIVIIVVIVVAVVVVAIVIVIIMNWLVVSCCIQTTKNVSFKQWNVFFRILVFESGREKKVAWCE